MVSARSGGGGCGSRPVLGSRAGPDPTPTRVGDAADTPPAEAAPTMMKAPQASVNQGPAIGEAHLGTTRDPCSMAPMGRLAQIAWAQGHTARGA